MPQARAGHATHKTLLEWPTRENNTRIQTQPKLFSLYAGSTMHLHNKRASEHENKHTPPQSLPHACFKIARYCYRTDDVPTGKTLVAGVPSPRKTKMANGVVRGKQNNRRKLDGTRAPSLGMRWRNASAEPSHQRNALQKQQNCCSAINSCRMG